VQHVHSEVQPQGGGIITHTDINTVYVTTVLSTASSMCSYAKKPNTADFNNEVARGIKKRTRCCRRLDISLLVTALALAN